jgi:hypothetical protein
MLHRQGHHDERVRYTNFLILERLEVPPGDQPVDPWFFRVPTAEDWAATVDRCLQSGRPWADDLRRAIPALLELSEYVEDLDPTRLVLTHTDFQRQNVLVESGGRFVLLDWDDAGPMTPTRSLAGALDSWHVRDAEADPIAALKAAVEESIDADSGEGSTHRLARGNRVWVELLLVSGSTYCRQNDSNLPQTGAVTSPRHQQPRLDTAYSSQITHRTRRVHPDWY